MSFSPRFVCAAWLTGCGVTEPEPNVATEPAPQPQVVQATGPTAAAEPRCPISGMVYVEGVSKALLGNPGCDAAPNTIPAWQFENIGSYCMFAYPFPGEGFALDAHNDSPDTFKLSYGEAVRIQKAVKKAHGLRLCTAAETLWAAGGADNLRFTYGDARVPGQCASDGDADGGKVRGFSDPIGSHAECVSWSGIHDIGPYGVWMVLDDQTRAAINAMMTEHQTPWSNNPCMWGHHASALDPKMKLIVGGPYQAVNNTSGDNWAWHHHLFPMGAFYDENAWPDGHEWPDDALRFCADPAPFSATNSETWQQLADTFVRTKNYGVLVR